MPQTELSRAIEQISREKGLDRNVIIGLVEEVYLAAARRGQPEGVRLETKYNPDLGEVEVFRIRTVVATVRDPEREISLAEARQNYDPEAQLGDEILEKIQSPDTRIAAQSARQLLVQKIRDHERELIYREFKPREGELIHSGNVVRVERRKVIVNLGRTEAVLPEEEQMPRERFRQGDHIRAYILRVEMTSQGPEIVLSRTHPGFLIKLFEEEVPEIQDGTVEIKAAAREPGSRAKIAVYSKDPDVDAVGACVGVRGIRVQQVTQELRGERIDVIPWDPRPSKFVERALSPAKATRMILDEDAKKMEIIVPDEELAQAIGKRGQNVRLAARLTGYDLTVKSESEAAKEAQDAREAWLAVPGIDAATADRLFEEGFSKPEELTEADLETLMEIEGLDPGAAAAIWNAVQEYLQRKQEAEAQKPTQETPAVSTDQPEPLKNGATQESRSSLAAPVPGEPSGS